MDWSWLRHSSLLHFSVTMYDYQAMCEPPDHRHSAAQALISVSVPPGRPSTGTHPLPCPSGCYLVPSSSSPRPSGSGYSGPCSDAHPFPWGCGAVLSWGGCSFSPPRLTLMSSGVPSTGLSEMGNDQTPEGFSNPTCGESDLQEAFEVPLLWCSF